MRFTLTPLPRGLTNPAMVRGRPRGVVVIPLLLIALAGSAEAQPQTEERTFDFSPKEGKPGRVVEVSGTGCTLNGRALETARVDLSRNVVEGGGEPFHAGRTYPVNPDGSWSGEFVVPADTPPGPYSFDSTCTASDFAVPGVDAAFPVLDRPPAVVTAKPAAVRAGDQLEVSVASCLFEDGSAASSAKFSVRDSTNAVIASTDAPVATSGTGAGTVRIPDSVASSGTASIEARCEGAQGAMVGRSASVIVGAAVPVTPPKVTLTG